jgi:hypothetical protein
MLSTRGNLRGASFRAVAQFGAIHTKCPDLDQDLPWDTSMTKSLHCQWIKLRGRISLMGRGEKVGARG